MFRAVSGQYHRGFDAGIATGFDIDLFVTDEPRAAEIDIKSPACVLYQAEVRFAAATAVVREMRAKIEGVDGAGQQPFDPGVNFMHRSLVEDPPTDAGLIRYHDHQKPGFFEQLERFCSERKNTQVADSLKEIYLLDQRAVAVDENGGFGS